MNAAQLEETRRRALQEALADAIEISGSFSAEPVLARTGEGNMKSRGVAGLKRDVEFLREKSTQKIKVDDSDP
jgi:hypothetical protein